MPQGLRLIGEEIMTDAKASAAGHGVPVKTGALRASGTVEQPEPLVVELSFGGAAAPYALAVHENVAAHHTVGEARYLVRALERWQPGSSAAMEALQRNTEEAIKTGGDAGEESTPRGPSSSGGGGAAGLINPLGLLLELL